MSDLTRLAAMVITASALLPATVNAAETVKKVKGWVISIDEDRFGGKSNVAAITVQDGAILAIRCLRGDRSIAMSEMTSKTGRYSEDDLLEIEFRADKKPVVEAAAVALDDKMIQLIGSDQLIDEIAGAKEFAFRVTFKGVTHDRVFAAGEAAKAVSLVTSACPLKEEKPK